MNSTTNLLNLQLALLVEQGILASDAITRINQSATAKSQNLRLPEDSRADQDLTRTAQQYVAMQPVIQQFTAQIGHNANLKVAEFRLAEQQRFIQTGWNSFRNSFITSYIYLFFLTALAVFFQFWIAPQFYSLYENTGMELPVITQLALGSTGTYPLLLLWLISFAYLVCLIRFTRDIKQFQFTARLLGHLPLLSRIKQQIDQLMLQAITEFLGRASQQPFPDFTLWQRCFPGFSQDQLQPTYQFTALGRELGTFNQSVQLQREQLENDFILQATRSAKGVTLLMGLLLGLCIAILVIAMYAPIFSLGVAL